MQGIDSHLSRIEGALISDCGRYRYWLSRQSETLFVERGAALFIMLNPSTADHKKDDATIRRCRSFAKVWGCDGIIVANLYAYRSTDPKGLWKCEDPVGPNNDYWLEYLVARHKTIICAWGNNAEEIRVQALIEIAKKQKADLLCLGTTSEGAPRHPLYVKSNQAAIKWSL